jgi:hypothetical protein
MGHGLTYRQIYNRKSSSNLEQDITNNRTRNEDIKKRELEKKLAWWEGKELQGRDI